MGEFKFFVRFDDGVAGEVDCHGLINGPQAGVFAALRNPLTFAQAHISFGAVCWPGELDLDPDSMHDALAQAPRWVLN